MDGSFTKEMERMQARMVLAAILVTVVLTIGGWELAKYLHHHLHLVWQ
jgi:hypothetical protein